VRRYSEFYRINTIKMYMTGNRKQRQWVIMAAKRLGLMPTIERARFQDEPHGGGRRLSRTQHSAHAAVQGCRAVDRAVGDYVHTHAARVVRGPWTESFFYSATTSTTPSAALHAARQIDQRAERRPWFRENQYVFPRIAGVANEIIKAGGHVGLGGHGQMDGLGDHWELWAMAAGGMSNLDVLRVATVHGANAIGMQQDLGSLEPGKLADLIVLDANPLGHPQHQQCSVCHEERAAV
jgi:hypothetical protein